MSYFARQTGQGKKGILGRCNSLDKGKEMWNIMAYSRELLLALFGQTRGRVTAKLMNET